MSVLTDAGREAVRSGAARYGVSEQAAEAMLHAVIRGNGTMAQFNISELGGSGQWLAGGMTMVGDMFNHGLQATVSGLAGDLSQAMANDQLIERPKAGDLTAAYGWWPEELGAPSPTGGQNDISYAVFPSTRRLAVRFNDRLHLFDTGDHNIGGVSQSQSGMGLSTLSFQSQNGTLAVTQLAPVAEQQPSPEPDQQHTEEPASQQPTPVAPPAKVASEVMPQVPTNQQGTVTYDPSPVATRPAAESSDIDTIISTIEKLAGLRDMGALTETEFEAKKVELLARL